MGTFACYVGENDIPDENKIQGTEILVIENGKTYRMNSDLEWIEKEE